MRASTEAEKVTAIGKSAFLKGKARNENPYSTGDPDHLLWREGWEEERERVEGEEFALIPEDEYE